MSSRRSILATGLLLGLHPALAEVTARSLLDPPIPLHFPHDDGPHDQPVEWWYFTGHLFDDQRNRFGFEYVVFKARKNDIRGYAANFAITDNASDRFSYDQRLTFAPAGADLERDTGFDLAIGDWSMRGADGLDHLIAGMDGYAIDLALTAAKPPALHGGAGLIDYGSGETSFYYSRTRIEVTGTLTVGTSPRPVTGEAWFDHQWGSFTTFRDGGWDWFALQLDDHTEVMLYLIRGPKDAVATVQGSFVASDGSLTVLGDADVTITSISAWKSEASGAEYPSGWRIEIPSVELSLEIASSLLDQELDTTDSTGVIYWEGEVTIAGTVAGRPVTGLGYVELTGYSEYHEPELDAASAPVASIGRW